MDEMSLISTPIPTSIMLIISFTTAEQDFIFSGYFLSMEQCKKQPQSFMIQKKREQDGRSKEWRIITAHPPKKHKHPTPGERLGFSC